jgi:hypothetical protein
MSITKWSGIQSHDGMVLGDSRAYPYCCCVAAPPPSYHRRPRGPWLSSCCPSASHSSSNSSSRKQGAAWQGGKVGLVLENWFSLPALQGAQVSVTGTGNDSQQVGMPNAAGTLQSYSSSNSYADGNQRQEGHVVAVVMPLHSPGSP